MWKLMGTYYIFSLITYNASIVRVFDSFTLETIYTTAFGHVLDIQRGESNSLTEAATTVLSTMRETQNNYTTNSYLFTIFSKHTSALISTDLHTSLKVIYHGSSLLWK